jgi:hypothetical protein
MDNPLVSALRQAIDPLEIDDLKPHLNMLTRALLALLELHEPEQSPYRLMCPLCLDDQGGEADFPCPSVRMLALALEIPVAF